MTLADKINEIVKPYILGYLGDKLKDKREREINQLTTAILTAFKEALPKEKEVKYKVKYPDCSREHDFYGSGHNNCLADINKLLEGR